MRESNLWLVNGEEGGLGVLREVGIFLLIGSLGTLERTLALALFIPGPPDVNTQRVFRALQHSVTVKNNCFPWESEILK